MNASGCSPSRTLLQVHVELDHATAAKSVPMMTRLRGDSICSSFRACSKPCRKTLEGLLSGETLLALQLAPSARLDLRRTSQPRLDSTHDLVKSRQTRSLYHQEEHLELKLQALSPCEQPAPEDSPGHVRIAPTSPLAVLLTTVFSPLSIAAQGCD